MVRYGYVYGHADWHCLKNHRSARLYGLGGIKHESRTAMQFADPQGGPSRSQQVSPTKLWVGAHPCDFVRGFPTRQMPMVMELEVRGSQPLKFNSSILSAKKHAIITKGHLASTNELSLVMNQVVVYQYGSAVSMGPVARWNQRHPPTLPSSECVLNVALLNVEHLRGAIHQTWMRSSCMSHSSSVTPLCASTHFLCHSLTILGHSTSSMKHQSSLKTINDSTLIHISTSSLLIYC